MIVRSLSPKEKYRASMVRAIAFEGYYDYAAEQERCRNLTDEQVEQLLHPQPHSQPSLPSDVLPSSLSWAAFSDDESQLYSTLIVNTYTVRFDGARVLMGGIGGVATLPEFRRKGGVRRCMEASFRDMYEKGYAFAALYPFSTSYYRQFGFEKGEPVHLYKLPLETIRLKNPGGRVRQLLPGNSLEPLTEIYNRFYDGCNLSVLRREYDPSMDLAKMLSERQYVFVWEDDDNTPGGFMIAHRDQEKVLDCVTFFSMKNGMLFLSARALQGMLAFVKTAFAANFQHIRFFAPSFVPLDSLIEEATGAEIQRYWNGMVRVVRLEEVLSRCRCNGKGTLVMEVEDPLLPENCGRWKLEFAPGCANRVTRTEEIPDVALPVGDLSVLLCGVRGAEEIPWMPSVRVYRPDAPLQQVFYRRPCHILDLF